MWTYFQPTFEYEDTFLDLDPQWAWSGHKFFAYDLVRNIKPQVIVELGTHKGTSFFSFSQGVKDAKIPTQLHAIDTWQGDKHAGYYGDEIFAEVNTIKDRYYKSLNITLHRKTFDEALDLFKDHSIDVLHIDGLHTYEAVKHDFETWHEKVKPNGIILFHDTHEYTADFGVHVLWKELKKDYDTLEFTHSHGLGILLKQYNHFDQLKILEPLWQHYYPLLFNKHQVQYQLKDITDQLTTASKHNHELESVVANQKAHITTLIQQQEILEQQLRSVTNAKFFKVWQYYCKLRDRLFSK